MWHSHLTTVLTQVCRLWRYFPTYSPLTIICLEINTTISLEVNYYNVHMNYCNNLFRVFYSNLLRHCQGIWNTRR